MIEIFETGDWLIEYDVKDGARLSRLCYHGFDLLTTQPHSFRPPSGDYGEYETRPVYGYDDCFPSVDVCRYPGMEWIVPDHGELCWLEWNTETFSDSISFSVSSKKLPVVFTRRLHFQKSKLTWSFEIQNKGGKDLPFQHIIHPLIKCTDLRELNFPEFSSVRFQFGSPSTVSTSKDLQNILLSGQKGDVYMLYVDEPKDSYVEWVYNNGLKVMMTYPSEEYTSIGIWWNHLGYPDEDGCRRDECAFEPIPGSTSQLDDACNEGKNQQVDANSTKSWEIVWALDDQGFSPT